MDPLDELKKDHASILDRLYSMDRQLGWLESSAPEKIPRLLSFLSRTADQLWKEFVSHIQREETILYAILESRLGYQSEPVAIMRKEHKDLLDCLSAVKSEISKMSGDLETVKTWGLNSKVQELRAGLSDHVSREERVVFWLAELHLSEVDRKKISFELLQMGKLRNPWKLAVPVAKAGAESSHSRKPQR